VHNGNNDAFNVACIRSKTDLISLQSFVIVSVQLEVAQTSLPDPSLPL